MTAEDLMTGDPACCTPDDSIRDAARLMQKQDCGSIPVVESSDSRKLVGVITDRDIALRAVLEGRDGETKIREVMSTSPVSCRPDADVKEIGRLMSEKQLRRIPIVDERGSVVGIVAQADLARGQKVSDREVARVVENVSEPTQEARRSGSQGSGSEARA